MIQRRGRVDITNRSLSEGRAFSLLYYTVVPSRVGFTFPVPPQQLSEIPERLCQSAVAKHRIPLLSERSHHDRKGRRQNGGRHGFPKLPIDVGLGTNFHAMKAFPPLQVFSSFPTSSHFSRLSFDLLPRVADLRPAIFSRISPSGQGDAWCLAIFKRYGRNTPSGTC